MPERFQSRCEYEALLIVPGFHQMYVGVNLYFLQTRLPMRHDEWKTQPSIWIKTSGQDFQTLRETIG